MTDRANYHKGEKPKSQITLRLSAQTMLELEKRARSRKVSAYQMAGELLTQAIHQDKT